MNTTTGQFAHEDGKTVYHADGYDKIVLEAIVSPASSQNSGQIRLHVESMWLDDPMVVEIPAAALDNRHQFSRHLGQASHALIKFLGSNSEFDAFVADELGIR